jgi:hypothetical protein
MSFKQMQCEQTCSKTCFCLQVNETISLYDGGIGNSFQFMHCWFILKNKPKWTSWLMAVGFYPNKTKSPGLENSEDGENMPPLPEHPMGWDNTKNQYSTPSSSSQSTSCLEVL